MRRFLSGALALILAAALAAPGRAAAGAEIIRAFVYDGTLYTYVALDGVEKPITKAEAKIGTRTFSAAGQMETVRQAGAPVTWLLLVDNSNSMPPFREEAEAFAGSLAQSSGENTRFIVATFGDAFSVAGEDVPAGELAEQIQGIPFDETVTRLHTAIGQALDYFEGLPRERNELRCLVILSDAVQYDPDGGIPYEALLERAGHSDVMLHSIGFGDAQESLDSLGRLTAASGGLHQTIGGVTAEEAGTALAESSGGLFVTGFDLSGYASSGGPEQVAITFSSGAELICRAEAEVELPVLEGAEEPVSPAQDPALPDSRPASGGTVPSEKGAPADGDSRPVLPVLAAAAVLLAAALTGVLLVKKKRAAPVSTPPEEVPAEDTAFPAGIYMRLEFPQGEGATMDLELWDELVIGSGPDCGIPLLEKGVSPRHARVFFSGGAVWLEDLGSQKGTSLNGAAVTQPTVLRSGDQITAGDVVFQLRF